MKKVSPLLIALALSTASYGQVSLSGSVSVSGQVAINTNSSPPPPPPCTITTTSEPDGVVGSPYPANSLATANCTLPVSYTTPSTVPGLTMNSAGVWSGTPTTAGNYSVTFNGTDSGTPAQHPTATLIIQITASSPTADNRYCNTNETTNFSPGNDGPATLPTACNRTDLVNTPATGGTVTATAGSMSSLQSVVNAAACGTTVVIPTFTSPGVPATYTGTLTVSNVCTGANWLIIETDQVANLPAEGSRATPAWIGIASLPGRYAYAQPPGGAAVYEPTILPTGTNSAIKFVGASHVRVIGIHATTPKGQQVQNAIVSMGGSDHIILDRSLVNGGNSPTGQSTDTIQVGVRSDGTFNTFIDGSIWDIHCVLGQLCQDNYAIFGGGVSTSTNGPIKAVNDYLEAAGQCFLDGGGGSGASTQALTDIEFRRNHCFKPLFWYTVEPGFFGTTFDVKNCFELKNANRVLFEGNWCENEWEGQSDQFGTMMLLGAKNQASGWNGTANTDNAGNVTWVSGSQHFSANQVSPNCGIPNSCKMIINGSVYHVTTFTDSTHVTVTPATPAQSVVSYTAYLPGLNPNALVQNVTVRDSLFSHASRCIAMFEVASDGGDLAQPTSNISVHDDVCEDISTFWVNAAGGCCFWAWGIQIQNAFASPRNMHDITINHVDVLAFQNAFTYHGGNGGPAFGGGFQSAQGGEVPNLIIENSLGTAGLTGSKSACTGSTGVGDSVLFRMQCYDTLNGVALGTYCFDHNMLSTTTQGSAPNNGVTSVSPYPGTSDSPGCGYTRTGTTLLSSFASFQFVNLNGASGGDYHLQSSSPGHLAASDGKDIGADINALNSAIAGIK